MELFLDGIKDIYWAENHLVKTLPKMEKAASSAKLKAAIADHLEVTKTHVARLEKVFELLGEKAQAKKCDAMEGISKEGDVLDLAVGKEIVEKSGAWFAYGGEKIGQGREASKQYLRDNPKIMEEIAKKVVEANKVV